MRLRKCFTIPLLAAQVAIVIGALPNCPYQGPAFPKPTNLASSDTIAQAVADLNSAFAGYENDPANNPSETSWSIQVFSASDANDVPIWEHYHTAANVNTSFTSAVDGNTIYRLGSVTKIFTILTFLVGAGDRHWNAPITDFVPELAQMAKEDTGEEFDPIANVDWSDVTLGALASQMAGIVRDYGILGELTQENNQSTLMSQGFPPAPTGDTPPCGEYYLCTREQLFEGLNLVPPSWAPYTTPGYSNLGYQLLAYALENITGRSFEDMLEHDVLRPLNLNHTYYSLPPSGSPGIVVNGNTDGWSFGLGQAAPTGNMYSSISDMASLGRSIFRHSLLSRAMTRRWLQPAALTSEMPASVGYPWGIRRIQLANGSDSNRIVDSYGKAGSINAYQSLLVLLPDYDVGITALLAGAWPGNANWDMADLIGSIMLPALEKTAQLQADAKYAGTYASSDTGDMNSSLVLSTDSSRPGLGVESWISNGTDMISMAVKYTLNYDVTYPMIRLYPTGLESKSKNNKTKSGGGGGGNRVAFKAVVENLDATDQTGKMFSTDCGSWISQTAAVYADMPMDQFVFTVDDNGQVKHIENMALRAKLDKVSQG